MNRISCDVVNDLLPLYLENMLSNDSKNLLEDHLKECNHCKNILDEMQKDIKLPLENDISPLVKLKKKFNRNKFLLICLSIIFTIAVMILGLIHVTSPIPLEYESGIISIEEMDDGAVLVTLSGEVGNYSIDSYLNDSSASEYIYHITVWTSLWNQYISNQEERSLIINKDHNGGYYEVNRVYFYSSDTTDLKSDLLIYSNKNLSSGNLDGVATLPRLALAYYLRITVILVIIGFLAWLITWKYEKVHKIIETITMLPIAYIISHFIIKGFDTISHFLIKDFTGILLLMIPIYAGLLVISKLIKQKTNVYN